ncbi:uncharacterized protein ARMOST_19817 [Armillaria ostoyae]|uniref:Integrase catalytic domain-containing protein n=1 Tax=Armillaria ostoyae TaxID=47428 RepID=A0A284S5M3_ARMOS|nr:uncharacterized protein ARMOST_19817 [Armillaria ostoyae]
MPHLKDIDAKDESSDFKEVTVSSMSNFNILSLDEVDEDGLDISLFEVEEYICDAPVADRAYVSTTFQGWKPTKSLHFLDSSASDHFLQDLKGFTKYMPQPYCTGSSAKQVEGGFSILGIGTATKLFHHKSGEKKLVRLTFKNALYTPSLAMNLISISALDAAGFYTMFGGKQAVIKDINSAEIFTGKGENGMYVLECVDDKSESPAGHFAMLSRSNPTSLCQWHRHLAHVSIETIESMASKNLVDGLAGGITDRNIKGKCEDCLMVKQTRRPFDEPTDPNVKPLHLMATDLWSPSCMVSNGGKSYFMPIVDSGTSFKHGAFLADKSDETTIQAFNNFRVLAENQTGQRIKRLHADNAFAGLKWVNYCKEHGIILELMALYSSSENGLVEWAIRTTIQDTHALL